MADKHYTPEQLQKIVEELQELVEEIIVYEYDYMTDEGKDALDRIAELLNMTIE